MQCALAFLLLLLLVVVLAFLILGLDLIIGLDFILGIYLALIALSSSSQSSFFNSFASRASWRLVITEWENQVNPKKSAFKGLLALPMIHNHFLELMFSNRPGKG